MTGADKVVCQAATLLVLFTLTLTPAKAQFPGGGGGGGEDMMTQMAPMLEMMKAKMGKQPLWHDDADHGSDDEPHDGKRRRRPWWTRRPDGRRRISRRLRLWRRYGPRRRYGVTSRRHHEHVGGFGGGELMSMIPQLMRMANVGGGRHGRRHRKR